MILYKFVDSDSIIETDVVVDTYVYSASVVSIDI